MSAPTILGKRFGKLTVLEPLPRSLYPTSKERKFRCQCDCGALHYVKGSHLRSGHTKSCGQCPRTPKLPKTPRAPTLAQQHPAEYETWRNMKKRCHYTGATKYYAYGAKGIIVANRWRLGENGKSGFECFLADMGPKPSPHHSINRINNNGNYEPANCTWSTPAEQAKNRRSTIKVILAGQPLRLKDAANLLNINYAAVQTRICRRKWPLALALVATPKTYHQILRHHPTKMGPTPKITPPVTTA